MCFTEWLLKEECLLNYTHYGHWGKRVSICCYRAVLVFTSNREELHVLMKIDFCTLWESSHQSNFCSFFVTLLLNLSQRQRPPGGSSQTQGCSGAFWSALWPLWEPCACHSFAGKRSGDTQRFDWSLPQTVTHKLCEEKRRTQHLYFCVKSTPHLSHNRKPFQNPTTVFIPYESRYDALTGLCGHVYEKQETNEV